MSFLSKTGSAPWHGAGGRSAIRSFAWRVRYARVESKNEEGEKLVLARQGCRVGFRVFVCQRERERKRKRATRQGG